MRPFTRQTPQRGQTPGAPAQRAGHPASLGRGLSTLLGSLALLGALAGALWLLRPQEAAERLRDDLPQAQYLTVRGGTLYAVSQGSALQVLAIPAAGGAPRILLHERPRRLVLIQALCTETEALCLLETGTPGDLPFRAAAGASWMPRGGEVPRAAGAGATAPGRRRPRETVLWRVPLEGGPVRKVRLETGGLATGAPGALQGSGSGGDITLSAAGAYWLRGRPSLQELVPSAGALQGRGAGPSEDAGADLLLSPLEGGPPRIVATGLSSQARVMADTAGVYWVMPRESLNPHSDLYWLPAGAATAAPPPVRAPALIRDYGSRTAPVRHGNRFYWIDRNPTTVSAGPSGPALISARPDGSDSRVELFPGDPVAVRCRALLPDGDTLYLLYHGSERQMWKVEGGRTSEAAPRLFLARLDPDGQPLLQAPRLLPPSCVRRASGTAPLYSVDGGSLYCVTDEEQSSAFDFAFARSTARFAGVAYRVPLPRAR